ncbi:MAG: hypothetical protein UW30_C0017G0017 [Candidatus Giovannonibacteria bacterium GW2011_GWA2_44_13b]|uniref:DUF4145 domain-containing protein n=2 Tax=Candidatus Giovannoniibacteriota TaxID=1752738 RepID=A0A0G1JA11_9BACT|nr:MAG: hypothetical protein UW30_C0017G0017 [Candidatus Giovannonibacteria bacterium GW2011_GWA2_44_13b]OGF82020.1 MAG: hypothetical protein A2924_00250 [Candidatus Giovannonibacteria bacterium RIFCSPLOWO2_01_FULL_44_16]
MEKILKFILGLATADYSDIIFVWQAIVFPVCLALICGIFYSVSKTVKIFGKRHSEILRGSKEFMPPPSREKNIEEWTDILAKSRSQDENQRKFAIIAADSLIEKILALAGYEGDNLGERLKKIESSDLDSLNDVWEAHKVRNRIAHEADYRLSAEDSAAAIGRFERALRELEYI